MKHTQSASPSLVSSRSACVMLLGNVALLEVLATLRDAKLSVLATCLPIKPNTE